MSNANFEGDGTEGHSPIESDYYRDGLTDHRSPLSVRSEMVDSLGCGLVKFEYVWFEEDYEDFGDHASVVIKLKGKATRLAIEDASERRKKEIHHTLQCCNILDDFGEGSRREQYASHALKLKLRLMDEVTAAMISPKRDMEVKLTPLYAFEAKLNDRIANAKNRVERYCDQELVTVRDDMLALVNKEIAEIQSYKNKEDK